MESMPLQLDSAGAIERDAAATRARQTALDERMDQRSAEGANAEADALQSIGADQDALSTFLAHGPNKVALPEPPKTGVDPQDMQQFATMLMAMAAIGGAASGGNWLGVGQTLTGALKGYNEGNKQAAQNAYEQYKTQFASAKAKEDQANTEFDRVLKSRDMSINRKIQEYKILSAKYDRPDAEAVAQQRSIDGMWKQLDARRAMLEKLNESHDKWTAKIEEQIFRDRTLAEIRREAEAGRMERFKESEQNKRDVKGAELQEKGWQLVSHNGKLWRVNAALNEAEQMNDETGEWTKIGGGGSKSGGNATADRVMAMDIGRAAYDVEKMAEFAQKDPKHLPGATQLFNQKMDDPGLLTLFERYMATKILPGDQQTVDGLMLNLAFDLASAASGGRGQLANFKITEVKSQMPFASQPESAKRQRWDAIFNALEEGNKNLPEDKRVDVSKYRAAFGLTGEKSTDAATPAPSDRVRTDMGGDPQVVFNDISKGKFRDAKGKEYTPTKAERRKVLETWLGTPEGQAYSVEVVRRNSGGGGVGHEDFQQDFGITGGKW